MTDFFDWSKPSFASPPKLPSATVDETEKHRCEELYASRTLGL